MGTLISFFLLIGSFARAEISHDSGLGSAAPVRPKLWYGLVGPDDRREWHDCGPARTDTTNSCH